MEQAVFGLPYIPVLSFEIHIPLAYSKDGRTVLMEEDYGRFVWYDLELGNYGVYQPL